MALVVFLRGLNVGGHRRFRPSTLVRQLTDLDVVNIGAAGTFVIRAPVSRSQVRAEFARRLPFDARIAICRGSDIAKLMARDFFAGYPVRPDVVRFVSVLSGSPRTAPPTPLCVPPTGTWLVRVLAYEKPFIVGLYRRQMKAIGCLGSLDRLFGVPVTTRNWNTIAAIAKALNP